MSSVPVLRIDYESEGFSPGGPISNGKATLITTCDELLWAALTVGRPNRQYVFRHRLSSMYEALFRLSLVRMALEQSGPYGFRLRRTAAAKTLDPSEKGAINYFLGMTVCKLFSAKLLDAPWVLHLDVFRPQLYPVLTGRSRPDLVGQTSSGDWIALESKGRISPPGAEPKNKAKEQAVRLVSANGVRPSLQIGAITYFCNDVLQFFWRDPEPDFSKLQNPIKTTINQDAWSHCYGPVLGLLLSRTEEVDGMLHEPRMVPIKELDIELGVYPFVLKYALDRKWEDVRRACADHKDVLLKAGYQQDGIRVVAGSLWLNPFSENE